MNADERATLVARAHTYPWSEDSMEPFELAHELIAQIESDGRKLARIRAYAEDRAFHARGHLNTVNSGRIAADLLTILEGGDDE